MRTARQRFLVLLLILSPSLLAAAEEAAQDPAPNFTGNWALNKKRSDPIQPARPQGGKSGGGKSGRGMSGSGGRGGGGRSGGGGGMSGGGGHGGGGDAQQPSAQDQQKAMRLENELSRLEIFQEGIEMNVTNGLDISRLLFTDNRTMTIWTQRGEAKANAHWEGPTLIVQWKSGQDTMSRVRRYTLSESGFRLTVTEKRRLPGGDKYREMTLVYDKRP
jgi:hypothetical protein